MARWELNRADSLNIAFVKGALVGMACGQVLVVVFQFLLRQFLMGPGPMINASPWTQTLFSLVGMITPMSILIGGLVGRSRVR